MKKGEPFKKKRRQGLVDEAMVTGINVAPLVDCCLVLVIIFMVTAPMLSDPAFKVELPKAHTQEGEEKDKTTLSVNSERRYALDEKEFKTLDEMTPVLKEKLAMSESKLVILRADKEAIHGDLTELMSRAKEAGALSLTIATEAKR